DFALLLAFCAVGSLGDRAGNVLTKLYATRIAGPDRVRYQAIQRTVANAGWALGGLAAAAALALNDSAAYQWLLVGDGLSFLACALLTLRCGEPPSASRTVATSRDDAPATPPRAARPAPAATAPPSPTSPPSPSSSSTTRSSRWASPCGSSTPRTPRTALLPC